MLQQAHKCTCFGLNPRLPTPDEVFPPWLRSAQPFRAMIEGCKRCHDRCCKDADQSLKKSRFRKSLSVQADDATPSQMRSSMPTASRSSHLNDGLHTEEEMRDAACRKHTSSRRTPSLGACSQALLWSSCTSLPASPSPHHPNGKVQSKKRTKIEAIEREHSASRSRT